MLLRKFIILLALFLLSPMGYGGNAEVLSSGEGSLSILYTFEGFTAAEKEGYHHVAAEDCEPLLETGKPVIPVRIARILLPEGKTPGKVTAEASFRKIPGKYNLPTAQPPVKIGGRPAERLEFAGFFPDKPYEIINTAGYRGYNIATVRLYPFTYDTSTKTLACTDSITLEIPLESEPPEKRGESLIKSRPFEKDRMLIAETVDNPGEIAAYREGTKSFLPLGQAYDYIIITNTALKTSFQQLAGYLQTNRGLVTGIFDVADIYDYNPEFPLYHQPGRDRQEQIRNFIIYAYNNWNTQYVLLGGNSQIIPVRYLINPNPFEGPIPSDIYYSNLDGDWDYNGDNIFGQGADGPGGGYIDTFADIFLGRAPVYNASEVENFTNKIINYTQTGNYDLKRAAFIGELLDNNPTWGGDAKDAIIRDCMPEDWYVSTFYQRDGTFLKSDILNYINNTTAETGTQVINILSHGSPENCGGFSGSDVRNNMRNTNYFLMYSQGCDNAWFDNPNSKSVGEEFVTAEHGAVAFIGNARFGWYSPGNPEYGGSQVFDKEFFNLLFNHNMTTLGQAYHRHKDNMHSRSRYIYYSLLLFGDPSMPVVKPRDTVPPLAEGYVHYVKDSDIWRHDIETGAISRLTFYGDIENLTVSEDGEKIVFSRHTGGSYKLFLINSDGSGLEDLTQTYNLSTATINQTYGVLSPDGKTLAFTATAVSNPALGEQLWAKELTGKERLLQLTMREWNCSYPSFIDNSYILFKTRNIADPLEDYYMVTAAGTNLTNITGNNPSSVYFPKLGKPVLNSDKTGIIYAMQPHSPSGYSDWSLYTRQIWTGGETLVLTDLYYGSTPPESQPDPMPAFVNGGQFIFRGMSPLSGEMYLYHTIFNSQTPYQSQLTGSIGASFPSYFLPLPRPVQFVYLEEDGARFQVHVRDYYGRDIEITDTVNSNNDPVFDFTGTYTAYSGNGIWVAKADATETTQIETAFSARYPAFSPDSEWLIYEKENDIYGRRVDKTVAPQRLTFSETSEKSDLSFSPCGEKILYTLFTGGTSQIYCLPVTIFDSYIRVDGDPEPLTTPPGNNYQGRWSYSGEHIIYISTSTGTPAIYTMNSDGTDKEHLVLDPAPVNPAFPSFSPYPEDKAAYISNGNIWLADLEEGTAEIVSPAIPTGKKFGWAQYVLKKIEARREFVLKQVDTSVDFIYRIYIETNKLNPSSNIVLTETLPETPEASADWVLQSAYWNGEELMPSNEAATGTLKWILGINSPLSEEFSGGVMEIILSASGDGPAGSIRTLNGGILDGENYYSISGDAFADIGDPLIPADTDEDWEIEDTELLTAIDYWAANSRMGGWPMDTGNWDFYLLQLIDFWINGGYEYVPGESRWRVN